MKSICRKTTLYRFIHITKKINIEKIIIVKKNDNKKNNNETNIVKSKD